MNDPNGLVLHDGEYHLFFQHLPDSLVHGPMSWGHAVSNDLVDWTELPVALAATDTEHVWSGSVVHDAADTSGLGVDGAGPLVALWTAFEPVGGMQRQSLSWSVDPAAPGRRTPPTRCSTSAPPPSATPRSCGTTTAG
jgi:sucrose-6-phosphate hydrolase SacC (GH32 family)